MYESLESCASDMGRLSEILANAHDRERVNVIRTALMETANNIANAFAATEADRDNLRKLYRGFYAASRLLACLQEERCPR